MNAGVVAIAVIFFVAFSIGLNLGLHGVLNSSSVSGAIFPKRRIKQQAEDVASGASSSSSSSSSSRGSAGVGSVAMAGAAGELSDRHFRPFIGTAVNTPPPTYSPTYAPTHAPTSSRPRNVSELLLALQNSEAVLSAMAPKAYNKGTTKRPIFDYLNNGGTIPIVLLTCNRAELLEKTLKDLLAVRGVKKKDVLVMQDGRMEDVERVVRSSGVRLVQNSGPQLRGGDGAARIAQHYKFALSGAFDQYKDAPAVIIVEDDLLFSPDFYEYFVAVAPVLEADESLFVVSAWNDNGFKGKVADPAALRRTEFFPGLGWLLPRALYKQELEAKWPSEHWDHWLRSPQVHRNREVVYPQVPRTFHNGIRGTFMNLETHNRYFRDIAYNRDPSIAWASAGHSYTPTPVWAWADKDVYEARIQGLLQACTHVSSVRALMGGIAASAANGGVIFCAWIDLAHDGDGYSPPPFEPVARFFGLWHEHKRGAHKGLHEFYFRGSYVLLLNAYEGGGGEGGSYKAQRPAAAPLLSPREFDIRLQYISGK